MNLRKDLIAILSLLIVIVFNSNGHAQKKNKDDAESLSYLTNEQKALLKEQQSLLDKTKEILLKNLSKEQLTALNNRTLSKTERTRLLRGTLSNEQRNIIARDRHLIRAKRLAFRNSLTKRQKIKLKRFLRDKTINDRRRLVRRLRRLIRDNIDG